MDNTPNLNINVPSALIDIFKYCVKDETSNLIIKPETNCSFVDSCYITYAVSKDRLDRISLFRDYKPIVRDALFQIYYKYFLKLDICPYKDFTDHFWNTKTKERIYCYYLIIKFFENARLNSQRRDNERANNERAAKLQEAMEEAKKTKELLLYKHYEYYLNELTNNERAKKLEKELAERNAMFMIEQYNMLSKVVGTEIVNNMNKLPIIKLVIDATENKNEEYITMFENFTINDSVETDELNDSVETDELNNDVPSYLIDIFKYCVKDKKSNLIIKNENICSYRKKCFQKSIIGNPWGEYSNESLYINPLKDALKKIYDKYFSKLDICTEKDFTDHFYNTNTQERIYCYYLIINFFKNDIFPSNDKQFYKGPEPMILMMSNVVGQKVRKTMKDIEIIKHVIYATQNKNEQYITMFKNFMENNSNKNNYRSIGGSKSYSKNRTRYNSNLRIHKQKKHKKTKKRKTKT